VLKLSNSYSKYKTKFEKYIENPRREQIKKSEITEIENLINNTNSKLDEIYSSLNRNDVKSQIYQIKFELDELSKLLEESKKKISKKEEFKKLSYKIEYYLYRMDVYLKGLSQNLSLL
jgi:paraquat-inducible protein B